jgi:hypothetical protein
MAEDSASAGQSTPLSTGNKAEPTAQGRSEAPQRTRWLRISVTETATGRPTLTLRLPVSLLDVALKLGADVLPGATETQMAALLRSVHSGEFGGIARVDDLDHGERVEVTIE